MIIQVNVNYQTIPKSVYSVDFSALITDGENAR